MTTVVASESVCPPGDPAPGWIAFDDDIIIEVGAGRPPAGSVDLGDALLTPAFVDLQCNGVGTVDLATADPPGWNRVATDLAAHGVGAFLPTFVTAPLDRYDAMLDAAAAAVTADAPGTAAALGVHLEGPFLGGAPGAHDPGLLRVVDVDWILRTLARHPGLVRIVTVAPEADPDLAGTRALVDAGVVVSLGHTTATYEEALAAADIGASAVTHLFNGMTLLHHREPGVVGAGLDDDRLTPTVIADLVHVHPAALRLAFAREPRVAVVSDSVAEGPQLVARDGAVWRSDGTMAGAVTLLDGALANLVASGIPVAHAVRSVTSSPARIVAVDDRGVLRAGARADLVVLDPTTMAVRRVWLDGIDLGDAPVASGT